MFGVIGVLAPVPLAERRLDWIFADESRDFVNLGETVARGIDHISGPIRITAAPRAETKISRCRGSMEPSGQKGVLEMVAQLFVVRRLERGARVFNVTHRF